MNSSHAKSHWHKPRRVIVYVCSLVLAVVAGIFLERYLGYSSTLAKKKQLDELTEELNANGPHAASDRYRQLIAETAALEIRAQQVEDMSDELKNEMAKILPEEEQGTELGELRSAAPDHGWDGEPVADPDIADQVQAKINVLRNKLDRQYDQVRLLGILLQSNSAALDKLPTAFPVQVSMARLSSPFGYRIHPITHKTSMHTGVDFATAYGSDIYAASSGIVSFSGYKSGYGYTVDIDHGNHIVTRYAHASKLLVKEGDLVKKHQKIAEIGTSGHATGPHLHFETRIGDRPVDPMTMLGSNPLTLIAQLQQSTEGESKLVGKPEISARRE